MEVPDQIPTGWALGLVDRDLADRERPSDVSGRTFFRGDGCDNCNATGYKGRLALFEIMILEDVLRESISTAAFSMNPKR